MGFSFKKYEGKMDPTEDFPFLQEIIDCLFFDFNVLIL
jgi:hypothetical protein